MSKPDVTVLLSGGIDSFLIAHLIQESGAEVEGLFLDYGQGPRETERGASKAIADLLGIKWSGVNVGGVPTRVGEIPGRNDLFIATAAVFSPEANVAIGTHGGTPYRDCSPEHIAAWQTLLDVQRGGTVTLMAPLIEMNKGQVIALAQENDLPLELTHSCEVSSEPCGDCPSCEDRIAILGTP